MKESGILINGDDIGFVTDAPGYRIWKEITHAGGLSPSLGKNFCSERFIVLNSTFYVADEEWWDSDGCLHDAPVRKFKYLPYINYGLLQARNENGTPIKDVVTSLYPSGDPRTPGIGALAQDLIKGHPETVQVDLLKRFLESWKPHLNKWCPRGMSYFLPVHLGGLGLPSVGEFTSHDGRGRYSRQQRVLASFLAETPDRQEQLSSFAGLRRSDSLSLWKKASGPLRKILSHVPITWVKEKVAGVTGVTPTLLASAYARLEIEDLAEVEVDDAQERYREWRREYEELFDHAARTTFAPLTDEQIASDVPWTKKYADFSVYDFCPRIDLRSAPSTLALPTVPRLIRYQSEVAVSA